MKNENQNSIKQAPIFKRFRRVLLYSMFLIATYLIVGYFFHLIFFPENKPNVSTYFTPGQVFYSKTEGFRQTVVKQENGLVYCSLEIEPYASGPPTHIHTSFDEYFEIESGVLSVWVDGEIKKIRPGETLHVPQGTPHRPFNDTADRVRLKGTMPFLEDFAFSLVQVYGLMDNTSL